VIPIYPLSPTLVVKLSSAELLSALFPIRRRELAETALSSPDAAPLCARPCSSVPVSCRQSELMSAHSHLSAEYWQWWYSLCQPRLLPLELEVTDQARDPNEVQGPVAQHLVGNREITAPRVLYAWSYVGRHLCVHGKQR